LASFATAVNCTVAPNAVRAAAPGVTATATGTWLTVREAEPERPAVVAVIVAEPLPTAVTRPDELTVAMLASEDDQVNVLPESVSPLAS
jgi:hypothetical protein